MARRYRPRKLFKFWLYRDLDEDIRLMEYMDYLRQTRQFATVLRNGLRLMWTLGQGDLKVLFELFPGLRASLQPVIPASNDEKIKREIDEIKRLILEQGRGTPANAPLMALPLLKSIAPPPVAQAKSAPVDSEAIAENFLAFLQ